jgi:hypothetical protein
VQGPEFIPQYHQKQNKTKQTLSKRVLRYSKFGGYAIKIPGGKDDIWPVLCWRSQLNFLTEEARRPIQSPQRRTRAL